MLGAVLQLTDDGTRVFDTGSVARGRILTFEVLLVSFELEHDVGLTRLPAPVRHLDIGSPRRFK